MALQVKSLTVGKPLPDVSMAAMNDSFNVIPTPDIVHDLYVAPSLPTSPVPRTAIISNIRLINTHATDAVQFTLYFNRPDSNGCFRRRQLTPPNVSLPAGFEYIDDDEITLEPGDRIQAKANAAGVLQYLISGVERDV